MVGDACTTREEIHEKIIDILCSSREPLEFDSLFNKVREACMHINKFLFREVLAMLVREGLVKRISGEEYGKPRMVFVCVDTVKS
ncbi:hypothetical protein Pyrfu_0969 [Pyrolobus fumarii 1A]|uniref:Uncharacterized protein n=1 Tax=Pyrolobus fumarii (strain DSM 11204 / 1A) TaxID=694429 RepID=G0EEL6_PYRF1|nr:hypothetical protein [Pyrolobus fumarii]AEM38838.1 hypothetical protein Pyrfu_0969 [Pyrolobus fumarii 1A]